MVTKLVILGELEHKAVTC